MDNLTYTIDELAFVDGIVAEFFAAVAVLHVVEPVAFVLLHLLVVYVFSESVCLVVDELSLVVVAVGVPELSFAVCFSVTDVAGVCRAVRPFEHALAVWDEDHILGAAAVVSLEDFHLAGVVRPVRMDLEVFFFYEIFCILLERLGVLAADF